MNYNLRLKNEIKSLPKSPGVYEFRDKNGKILYIGKATSLNDRVRSYFCGLSRGSGPSKIGGTGSLHPRIANLVSEIADIKIHKTDSALEALILEANLIKKYQPRYNVRERDDKSFGYFVITKEEFPRVLIVFKTQLGKYEAKKIYGPYLSKHQMETALKIIRKIFPFHSAKQHSEKYCLDFQLGRCPGPWAGTISKKDYLKNIHAVEMILQGKKKKLLTELEKQMRAYSRRNEFEKAAELRNKIFTLEHIRDVALISGGFQQTMLDTPNIGCWDKCRIEAYDISNIGGDFATGSMIVFAGNKPDKSQYRKFKILTVKGIDDVGMMREVLRRRFQNNWPLPDLIFVDGGKGHLNMAQNVIWEFGYDIPVVAVAKGSSRKKIDIYYNKGALVFREIISNNKLVERIRNEAHRFAIGYHRKLRRKNWKEK